MKPMTAWRIKSLGERASWGLGCLLLIVLMVCAVLSIAYAKAIGVLFCVAISVPAGVIAWRLFGCPAADRFANFLLYPKQHLQETPVSLTPAMSLIANGRFAEAEEELVPICLAHPEAPQAVRMLMELYSEHMALPEKAVELGEYYFSEGRRRAGEDNFTVLMSMGDQLLALGRRDDACELLRRELEFKSYSSPERASMKRRLAALSGTN